MAEFSDIQLIQQIKESNSSDALIELNKRHAALCNRVYQKYASAMEASGHCIFDLQSEQAYIVYTSALKFNPDKKTKFSTYLCDNIRYQCLDAINENYPFTAFPNSDIEKFSPPVVSKTYDDTVDFIFKSLAELKDKRIITIFEEKLKNDKVTLGELSKIIGVSKQHVLNLYKRGREHLLKELKKEILL